MSATTPEAESAECTLRMPFRLAVAVVTLR